MRLLTCIAAVCLLAGASPLRGSLLLLGPDELVNPAGRIILTIQNEGTASGCVGIFGGADIMGLGACPGAFTGAGGNEISGATATLSIADLHAIGINTASDLVLGFRLGEAGPGLGVQDLALVFFDVTNDTSFTINLPGTPFALPPGAGLLSSFAFRLDTFESQLAEDFFVDPGNRVGAALTLTGSTGAADSLVVSSAVPEPGVFWQLAIGLGILVSFGRMRRRLP